MNYKKLFGWGIAIWGAAYLVATGFVAYKMQDNIFAEIVTLIAMLIVLIAASRNLPDSSLAQVLKYSVGWVVIGVILDLVLTVPFTGYAIFYHWTIWVSYALILVLPPALAKRS